MIEAPPTVVVRGTGSIGRRHLHAIRDVVPTGPVAFPVRASSGASLRDRGIRTIHDFGELGVPDGGAVYGIVATDTARHIADAIEMLSFGDVLIEKPLAPSCDGLVALEQAARRNNRHVFVGFQLRQDPSLQAFRDLVGDLGALHHIRIACQSYLPDWRPGREIRTSYAAREDEGGVLRDLSHELDYAIWLFGRPRSVSCLLHNTGRLPIEADDGADVLWEAPDGASVSIRLDYVTRHARRRIDVFGELGEATWDGITQEVTYRVGHRQGTITKVMDRDEMIRRQDARFIGQVTSARRAELPSLEEGAFVVALSDAARTANKTRSSTTVDDWRLT